MDVGTLTVAMGANTAGLARAQQAMISLQNQTLKSVNAINASLNTMVGQMTKVSTQAKATAAAVKAAGIAYTANAGSLDKLATKISTFSQKLRTFGYLSSAVITLPMVMAGKAAFNMAKDYEFAIQKIVGLTGVAQGAVNKWSDEILKMAPKLAQTPQALADALYFISSSGIKGAEAMNVLELSAKGASAGLGDTKDIANYLTSALNAYRDTGLTAAYATDVLVAAVREGKAEAAGFASAMGQLIPFAAHAGVSLDQIAGAMAAITLTGSTAANAAVYLKGVFNTLVTANKQGVIALKGMELKYSDLRKILAEGPNGLINLMQKFRDIQMKLGDEAVKDVLPNIRALTSFYSIAGKNFAYNTELMKRVTNATGSLSAAFAAVANTIKFRYDAAIAQANVSMIVFGKSLAEVALPMIEKLVKKLDNITKWFTSLSAAQQENKLHWLAFIAILGPATLLISVVGYAISGLINVVGLLTKAFNILRFAFINNPFTLAIVGITAMIIMYHKLVSKMKEVINTKTQLDQIWGGGAENDLLAGLTKGIASQMKLLDKMSKDQIITLQNNIGTVVQLYRDKGIKLLGIGKEGLKDDQWILDQKKKIANVELIIFTEKNKFGNLQAYIKQREALNTVLNEYKLQMKAAFEIETKSNEANIKYYEKLAAEVKKTMDVINAYAAAVQADMDAATAISQEIRDAWKDLQDTLKFIDKKAKIFEELGIEFDISKEKLEAFTSAFDTFVKLGLSPTNWMLKFVIQNLDLFDQKVKDVEEKLAHQKFFKDMEEKLIKQAVVEVSYAKGTAYTPNYTKLLGASKGRGDLAFMEDFQTELNLISLKNKVLGESFNTLQAHISFFKETLNKMWDAGMRPGKDPLMDALTDQMKKLILQQEIIERLTNAFTNFFMIGKEGFQDFGQYIKDWALSVLQTFQQLIAQILAKKIVEVLFPTKKKEDVGNAAAVAAMEVAGIVGKTVALSASIPITAAATAATTQLAVASAAAAAAWVPFPGTIAAVAANIAGVIAAMGVGQATATAIGAVPGLAEGGIIPPGYPHDSYPARLTSGEMVTPPGKLGNLAMKPQKVHVTVSGEISGKNLALAMRRATSMN